MPIREPTPSSTFLGYVRSTSIIGSLGLRPRLAYPGEGRTLVDREPDEEAYGDQDHAKEERHAPRPRRVAGEGAHGGEGARAEHEPGRDAASAASYR